MGRVSKDMLKKILQTKFNIVLIVIVGLIVIQLGSAYIFGFIIQKQKDQQFKYFLGNSSVIKVVKHEYHRGFFSSDIKVELALNSAAMANILKILPNGESSVKLPNNTYLVKYETHIVHGLFSGVFSGNFLPMLSYAKTDIDYSDNVKGVLKKFFNGNAPLEITDVTYLNKSGKITFFSPKFDYEEAVSGVKVIWGGMAGNLRYNDNFTKFNNNFSIPNLQLLAPTKGEMLLNGVSYASDSVYSPNKIKVGNTKLGVTMAKIEWKDKLALNFKLGDVLRMATGINSAEFLNGIDVINPSSFTFHNISYVANSSDENNFFGAKATVKFESLKTNGSNYGPLDLNLSVSHVLAPQFSKMVDDIDKFTTTNANAKIDDAARKDVFIRLLKDDFAPILVESPVLELSKFNLVTPSGLIQIKGMATSDGFVLSDISDQDKFMNKLLVDINFSLPKPVVSYLFVLQMKYLLSAGNAELDKQSSDALTKVVNILLDNQINAWTKKGYIKNNNGMLESHLVLHKGKLIINDIQTKK